MEELSTAETAVRMMLMLALWPGDKICAYKIWVARCEG